jgi:CheY-like chemotaxis protein
LNNAAKYTPDGGRIEVFCELTQPADKVRIRVRDNGIGIELGLLPRIFDLFTQSDRSLARSAGGLGVGLTLAHRLVEMQGGTIEAKSDGPGTGAEFTVTLVPVPRHAAPHQGVMFAPAPAAGLRILVVDDNLDLVTMLSGSLRHRGYEVREAYTGTDGLEIAKDWHPDVVLLDIGLPGLDGYEVATRIRGHASGRTGDQPRLVALTGYGRETDKQLAQEAGFDRHLTKPLDFEELAIVIAGLTKLPRP